MLKLGRILSVALITCLPLSATAAPVFVGFGETSVDLDTDLLETAAGLTFFGISPEVIVPGTLTDSVAFPINPRDAVSPVLPTTFIYESGSFAPFSGAIEHTGSVFFNNGAIEVGDFTIGFDAARNQGAESGFFVESTVGLEAILFDIESPNVLEASSVFLEVVGNLLVSKEFAAILLDTGLSSGADLTGADVGEALVEGTVPEPTTALLLGIGLVALGARRRSATS